MPVIHAFLSLSITLGAVMLLIGIPFAVTLCIPGCGR